MKYLGHEIKPCDCGGPQYGTDHSPDCAMILDAMRIEDIVEEDASSAQEQDRILALAARYFYCA